MEPLIFNELKKYINEDIVRFDVPGHKGNYLDNDFVKYFGENIIKADVNSMKRLDNLNFSKSIIKESQLNIAKLHNAKDARFLVNGTTIGIQVMILSSVKEGEKIIVPKNIHKSVQSALILSGAIPVYLDVEFDQDLGIYTKNKIDNIKDIINEHKDIKAALLINPSYYGVAYDFLNIVKLLKDNNIIVLVDEAHGGHFYLQDDKISAMDAKADMSSISYHKTLGTLTQTSLLLYNSDKVDIQMVDKVFSMLTTTSPSYIFMSNLEVSIIDLFFNKKALFIEARQMLKGYIDIINKIEGISVLTAKRLNISEEQFDDLRLVISVEGLALSGFNVYDILCDEYNIQIELGEKNIILCIVTIFDEVSSLDRLVEALKDISKKYIQKNICQDDIKLISHEQKGLVNVREIFYKEKELIDYKKCNGRVIGESLMLYPPGIPLILEGEIIDKEIIDYITYLVSQEETIYGMYDNKLNVIK